MTPWEVPVRAAMNLIKNDTLLDFERKYRPAAFLTRMAGYMDLAIARFCIPPEAVKKLSRFTAPVYDSAVFAVPGQGEAPFVIHTGRTGYGTVSAGIVSTDEFGDPDYVPLEISSYDPSTGDLCVAEDVPPGTELTADFYRDGYFDADLDVSEKAILAYCIYTVWEHRLDNDALERAMKLRDGAFSTISEANLTNSGTARMRDADTRLYDMLRTYSERLEYRRVMEEYG